jgi:hypothetical protein
MEKHRYKKTAGAKKAGMGKNCDNNVIFFMAIACHYSN